MDLPHNKQFHFGDGTSAKNLNELIDKIQSMSYDKFYNHVDSTKNDFANWIRFVLKDNQLADTLEKITSIVETVEVLNDYIYPKVAQQHLETVDDIQSHIEQEVLEVPAFPEDAPRYEEVIKELQPKEDIKESKIKESTDELKLDETKIEELKINETKTEETKLEETKPKASVTENMIAKDKIKKNNFATIEKPIDHDIGKLIVKDFIYGLIVGLIIGLILGKVISIGF